MAWDRDIGTPVVDLDSTAGVCCFRKSKPPVWKPHHQRCTNASPHRARNSLERRGTVQALGLASDWATSRILPVMAGANFLVHDREAEQSNPL
jgi:hypothetical protein